MFPNPGAIQVLSRVTGDPHGATVAVDANLMDHVLELLKSPCVEIRTSSCRLMGNLALRECTIPALLAIPDALFSSILREISKYGLIYPASTVDQWSIDVQSELDARAVNYLEELLKSLRTEIKRWLWVVLSRLAQKRAIVPIVFGVTGCVWLISLLCAKDTDVISGAICALSQVDCWPEGTQTVFDSQAVDHIAELIRSPGIRARKWSLSLLEYLPSQDTILGVTACEQLVSLLRDEDVDITAGAIEALINIALLSNGAQAVVAANVLGEIAEVLKSPNKEVRIAACKLVGRLADHDSIALAVFEAGSCISLVALLGDEYADIIQSAIDALVHISSRSDGALAAVAANVLEYIADLLVSSSRQVRRSVYILVGTLAKHQSTVSSVLALVSCVRLVSLLHDDDTYVIESAIYAVVAANVLRHIAEVLQSPNKEVRIGACKLVGRLARYHSTAPAVFEVAPCARLVSFLRDEDVYVIETATNVLYHIALWSDGAREAVVANVLEYLAELLESLRKEVRICACKLAGRLSYHDSTALAFCEVAPCVQIVTLLRDEDPAVIEKAICTLSRISRWAEGAKAVVDTKVLDQLAELLESPNIEVLRWTSALLATLASHECTVLATLQSTLLLPPKSRRFVSMLRDEDLVTHASGIIGLVEVSEWPHGLADPGVMEAVQQLGQQVMSRFRVKYASSSAV
ncbi:armadillo-type protein [Mycena maculata]|uniref:Armadillo-type protein n=1 Tax=Mycena maculata TaxID=230809 RepID=A0AAD7JPV0_9AGAR|nr:armadillo-type protein [Mycena maculata]